MRKASPVGTQDMISSDAPLTMLYSLSTNPVRAVDLPFPLAAGAVVGGESALLSEVVAMAEEYYN